MCSTASSGFHWTGKKKHYNATRPRHRILCAKLPDGHLQFECSVLHLKVDFYFKFDSPSGKQSSSGATLTSKSIFIPNMEVNGAQKQPGYKLSSKYLPLCSAEQRHKFGTT